MVFASISSLAVSGHEHLQDYRDLSQEHTTCLLVAMPELRTQEFLRHTLDTRSVCDGSIGRSIFCGTISIATICGFTDHRFERLQDVDICH